MILGPIGQKWVCAADSYLYFSCLGSSTAATDNGKGYEVDFFAFLKVVGALTNTTVKPDPAFAPSASSGPHFLTQLTQTLASRHFARLGRKATDGSESQNTNKIRKAIIRANKAMASVRAKPKMA
ncbi:hypothetical protein L1987_89675 [Smallanthus sonchifolius]|nr:hypothetical protein L1987_89675 [Smallanthus sonchifolius]